MKTVQYSQRPEALLLSPCGEMVRVTLTANARTSEDDAEQWEADTHEFWEKASELDLDALRANPSAWLNYVPVATRQEAKDKAQLMLDKLRAACPVVPVPGYREGAAICNRSGDQVKLVAGLAMGGLPYYELADGEIVSLSAADIKSIAADVAAAETVWQQAKQQCWAAIDTAQNEEDIAVALADFGVVLAAYAAAPITQGMNMNTNNKTGWLAGLLSGWGIRESWAKMIAGAIAGALAASGFLTGYADTYTPAAEPETTPAGMVDSAS